MTLASYLLISHVYKSDEWKNFEERIRNPKLKATEKDRTEATRQWVSYRGQTLSRTGVISFNLLFIYLKKKHPYNNQTFKYRENVLFFFQ